MGNFKEQTVIAVKAPPQTRLEVPDRSEVRGEAFGGEQVKSVPGSLQFPFLAPPNPRLPGSILVAMAKPMVSELGQKWRKLERASGIGYWPEKICCWFLAASLQP